MSPTRCRLLAAAALLLAPHPATAEGQLSGEYSAFDADITIEPTEIFGAVGISVASVGDFDGDGFDDFAVGAPFDGGGNAGYTYFVYGRPDTNPANITKRPANVDIRFLGESTGDNSGYTVSSAGDLNNDGLADLLIAVSGQGRKSKVHLVYGRPR